MKRLSFACGLFGVLLLAGGCGRSKPAVPSWFKGDNKDAPVAGKNSPEQLKFDLQSKIQQLKQKQAALDKVIVSVKKSKVDIAKRLNALGVRESADLNKPQFKDDDEVQRLRRALVKNLQEIAKYQQMRKEYASALFDGELALDQIDRQVQLAQAGFTEKELDELTVTIRKIDERLNATDVSNPVDPIKGDLGLEKELRADD